MLGYDCSNNNQLCPLKKEWAQWGNIDWLCNKPLISLGHAISHAIHPVLFLEPCHNWVLYHKTEPPICPFWLQYKSCPHTWTLSGLISGFFRLCLTYCKAAVWGDLIPSWLFISDLLGFDVIQANLSHSLLISLAASFMPVVTFLLWHPYYLPPQTLPDVVFRVLSSIPSAETIAYLAQWSLPCVYITSSCGDILLTSSGLIHLSLQMFHSNVRDTIDSQ